MRFISLFTESAQMGIKNMISDFTEEQINSPFVWYFRGEAHSILLIPDW